MRSPVLIEVQDLFVEPPERLWGRVCEEDPLGLSARRSTVHWVVGQELTGLQEPERGLWLRLWAGVRLEPAGQKGTLVRIFVELTPRRWWGQLLARFRAKLLVRRVIRSCRNEGRRPRGPGAWRRALYLRRMRSFVPGTGRSAELVQRLKEHLAAAPDLAVGRIRPFALADQWGVDRNQTLFFLMHAASAGLLKLQWELRCPACELPKAYLPSLDRVPDTFHCADCGLDRPGDLATHVELSFRVAPEVRPVRPPIRGRAIAAARQPGVLACRPLSPFGHTTVALWLGNEPMRLRSTTSSDVCRVWPVPSLGQPVTRGSLRLSKEGWEPKGHLFRPGRVALEIANESGIETVIRLERNVLDGTSLSGALAITFPGFRDLFPAESPEAPAPAGFVTFVALDVKEAPALYEAIGDEEAHVALAALEKALVGAVHRSGGTVVRHFGEGALIAAFPQAGAAVRAALTGIRSVDRARRRLHLPVATGARAGLYFGSALAVRREGRLDLLGQPAQRARAFLKEAQGSDAVFTPDFLELPGVREALEASRCDLFAFTTLLVEIGGTLRLCRAVPFLRRKRPPLRRAA